MGSMKQAVVLSVFEEKSATANPGPLLLAAAGLLVFAALIWQGFAASGTPDPLAAGANHWSAIFDIGVLVFREGLECVLVLAAITAGTAGKQQASRRPIAVGAGFGLLATLATWMVAVRILSDLSNSVSALALQAATGLLAVLVLLIVMNWFFHKFYWTGCIALNTGRKQYLLKTTGDEASKTALLSGMALLGFTSFYREGFEVVLFLQSYRLRLGNAIVGWGVSVGVLLTAIVAVLTFVAHRKLPYRKMLVLTGILLGLVLIVMVGEQTQEMQLAHWIRTTNLISLNRFLPNWMGLWFSVFPTIETLVAQFMAAALVIGSYFFANRQATATARSEEAHKEDFTAAA
jgi:high-affinity iron transporter